MIPQRNLSLLSNRLARGGGRRIPESVLERDYCLAWFLAGLASHPFRNRLGFKGGTALKRCYFADYRFSEDLDFTLLEPTPFDETLEALQEVYRLVREASAIEFAFDREDRQAHSNSHTFYLSYAGPLSTRGGVKVDITISERIVLPIEERVVLRGYEEYSDVPEGRKIRAYSLGEIAAEKVIALADRARNEPRDLYDLWFLTSEAGVDLAELQAAIREKLAYRGGDPGGIEEAVAAKEARLRSLWDRRLSAQVSQLPRFEEVFRAVRRSLRQGGLPPAR